MPDAARSGALLCALCLAGPVDAQRARFPADTVQYEVQVAPEGTARVIMRAHLAAPVRTADFTYLAHACNPISAIVIQRGATVLGVSIDTNPPWVAVHDTTPLPGDDSLEPYDVTWTVAAGDADGTIPLLLPAAVLDGGAGGRAPEVAIVVHLPAGDDGARVTSPRMSRSQGRWTARTTVIPSSIRVHRTAGPGPSGCEETAGRLVPGESGRFRLIFVLLLGTMILWVPLFFWWASRQGDAP